MALQAAGAEQVRLSGRVLFLGDSITHAGHFVSMVEAVLEREGAGQSAVELINLGLPSEGVTGLSEPDHPFPRPNVHERLQRALDRVKPDLVIACYGMNDGIYYPFEPSRFEAYQRGMLKLIAAVKKRGVPLVLMTPPPFDPEPLRSKGKLKGIGAESYAWFSIYEGYDDEVISRYAFWVREQAAGVDGVVDLWNPVQKYVARERKRNPSFVLSPDGVHLNESGHRVLAQALLRFLGRDPALLDEVPEEVLQRTHRRQMLLHEAWVSHVGHKRPGVKAGLPLRVAKAVAKLPESESLVELFNGKDLKGWDGAPAYWSVADGVIVGKNSDPVPSSTYLFTGREYRNFRLVFEVKQKVASGYSTMHSAVAVLGERFEDAGGNAHGFRGPLLMFCHDWGIWDAYRRNRIEPAGLQRAQRIPAEVIGDWNLCEVLVRGNRLRFVANGELVFDFSDRPEMLRRSPLGLQLHKNRQPQEYRFRGLVLTENPEDSLITLPR